MDHIKNIVIFASGNGTNARAILNYFKSNQLVKIALIVTNNKKAGVLSIAKEYHVPTLIIEKERFFSGDAYVPELSKINPELIVLAGFLWKVPATLIDAYPEKIINLHPALLPLYGGKGMYGNHVHEAVLQNKEKETGITIHVIDNHYDEGKTLFQARCPVLENDTPDTLANRIHELEHQFYPEVIERILF